MELKLLILFLICCPSQCEFYWECGDKEIRWAEVCDCSGKKIQQNDYWDGDGCCPIPGGDHCEITSGGAKCSNSTLYKSKHQPCNGECHSLFGTTLCPDEMISYGAGHQQCYWPGARVNNDGSYHCLNRADEKKIAFQDINGEYIRNYSSVVPCNRSKEGRVEVYGKRCTGQRMECYYPLYMSWVYDYNEPCSDKSDQIHKRGTNCTIDQHLDIYTSLFCNDTKTEATRGFHCDLIQSWGRADWISFRTRGTTKSKFFLDPHNCQASCQTPDYGCEACTNSSYFKCPVNGEPHCLHPDLVCDGHPQCDNAEDEDFWKCRTKLIKLKTIKQEATFYCKSKMYPHKNHWTAAVACDGNADCYEDQDEGAMCQKITLITSIGVPVSFLILVCIAAGLKWYSDNKEEKERENENCYEENITEEAVALSHETNTEKSLNVKLLRNDLLNDKETRIKGSCWVTELDLTC